MLEIWNSSSALPGFLKLIIKYFVAVNSSFPSLVSEVQSEVSLLFSITLFLKVPALLRTALLRTVCRDDSTEFRLN